ncbi:MAG: hypothetical protein ABI853_09690 [Sphingomicrobium sp.]
MFNKRDLEASLDELEIGATGPNQLKFVLRADRRNVTVKLNASEARWLASALEHWAESSETIPPVRPIT